MSYIDKLIEDRKNFLESKLKGKKETIRIYTEEIARCNKSIKDIEKELEEIKNGDDVDQTNIKKVTSKKGTSSTAKVKNNE